MIAEGAFPDSSGDLAVSLLAAGHYEVQVISIWEKPAFGLSINVCLIQVSGTGYVSTRKSIGVACSPSDCSLCAPSIMVPLSPGLKKLSHFLGLTFFAALGSDELRLTLGGNQLVENLVKTESTNNFSKIHFRTSSQFSAIPRLHVSHLPTIPKTTPVLE